MSRTPLPFYRIDIPCPHCDKVCKKVLVQLVDSPSTPCDFCGQSIDLSSQKWRALIAETVESVRHITITKPD